MVLPPGHHRDITTSRSFSRKEKWTVGVVLAAVAVFAIVLVISLTGPTQSTARGCVDVSIVGATGGAAIHQCGENARALCRSAATSGRHITDTVREIRAACRRDGFAVG
ncbi:MAG: hypothetical protein M3065_06100 [Actinomycetota bacterium]|nr:hypothetical protein [Actinomycetota bacterium]